MKEKTTRDMVIEILAEEWPLTARVIYNRVKKKYLKSITYQAVYKTMQKMLREGVIEKEQTKYRLDISWVTKSKEFLDYIEKHYENKSLQEIPYSKSHLHNYVKYSFKTVIEIGDYFINYFLKFPNPKNEAVIARWFAMYSLIGLSKKIIDDLKKIFRGSKNKYFVISKSNSLYDKFIARAYLLFGKNVHIKLGIECSDECDYIVVGDYIARIYFSLPWKKKVKKLTKNIRGVFPFNLKSLFEIMHLEVDPPHHIIIEKNKEIAKQIRKDTLRYFNL